MLSHHHSAATPQPLRSGVLVCVLLVAVVGFGISGCATYQERGDRALEQGSADRALDYYEQAIAEGTRDPQIYRSAAHAAQQLGAFAKAERFFSQALRYGGGVETARELATFYIQTSNFVQAVQVFRYLIQIEEDQEALQPMYSNLGTALKYSGDYLDAEAYLLLAQQIDPTDPVPYVNLGSLYDRHLRNLPKAVRFYECFVQMTGDTADSRQVQTRLRELNSQRRIDTSRVNLECGDKYRAAEPEQHDLREVFGLEDPQQREVTDEVHSLDLPLDYEPGTVDSPPPLVDEPTDQPEEGEGPEVVEDPADIYRDDRQRDDAEQRAEEAYEAGRYDEAVQLLEKSADGDGLTAQQEEMLGRSYYRVGRFDDAVQQLESAVEQRPTPQAVRQLISAYERTGQTDDRDQICERFGGWPDYAEAVEQCR